MGPGSSWKRRNQPDLRVHLAKINRGTFSPTHGFVWLKQAKILIVAITPTHSEFQIDQFIAGIKSLKLKRNKTPMCKTIINQPQKWLNSFMPLKDMIVLALLLVE